MKSTFRNISVLIFLPLLLACASSYSPKMVFNGYSDIRLGENIFQVSFQGDGFDSRERVANLSLLRCAEVTLENGFKYFAIVRMVDNSGGVAGVTPMTTQIDTTTIGNTTYGTATTYGGHSFFITYPNTTNTIMCFKEKPDFRGLVYNAKMVASSLKAKYGID